MRIDLICKGEFHASVYKSTPSAPVNSPPTAEGINYSHSGADGPQIALPASVPGPLPNTAREAAAGFRNSGSSRQVEQNPSLSVYKSTANVHVCTCVGSTRLHPQPRHFLKAKFRHYS